MEVVNQKTNIKIYWKIFRGENKVSEDFNNSCTSLNVYLVGACDKYVYTPKVNTTIEPGYQVLEIDIPANSIREGAYDIKAIWKKNERTILTTSRCGVFGLTDSTEEAAVEDLKTIRIASYVESYGRDGMSVYETAVMYGLNQGINSEREWIEHNLTQSNVVQTTGSSTTDVMSQAAVTEAILTGGGGGGGMSGIPDNYIVTSMIKDGQVTKAKLSEELQTAIDEQSTTVAQLKVSVGTQVGIIDDIDVRVNVLENKKLGIGEVDTANIADNAVENIKLSEEVRNNIATAKSTADAAITAAGNAYSAAQALEGRVTEGVAIANSANATATSANTTAVAAGAAANDAVARVQTLETKAVTSTTITAMELITQSAYDTKKALGELSDTTAYLITE